MYETLTPGWPKNWPEIDEQGVPATVCFIRRHHKVLLQLKAAHKFGGGRWNGPGGKVEPGETTTAGIIREVREETNLVIEQPRYHGGLVLVLGVPEQYRLTAHVFTAEAFTGKPSGNEEGRLRWFAQDRLPYDQMWVDMRYWLPMVLDGGEVRGMCVFSDMSGTTMLDCQLAVGRRL